MSAISFFYKLKPIIIKPTSILRLKLILKISIFRVYAQAEMKQMNFTSYIYYILNILNIKTSMLKGNSNNSQRYHNQTKLLKYQFETSRKPRRVNW